MNATRHPLQLTVPDRRGWQTPRKTKPSARATKRAETRERIVQAAFTLFREKGYDGTTVDEIVELAGVGKRTFFRHFPAKVEVAFPHEQQRLERFAELLEENFDLDNPVHGVARALFALLPEYQRDRDLVLAERQIQMGAGSWEWMARDAENNRVWRDLIAQALARGQVTALEARVLAAAIYASAEEVMDLWFSCGCRHDLSECVGPILGLLAWIAERYDRQRETYDPQAFLERIAAPASAREKGR
jgi:AcrR family transcriptional regulator